MDEVERELQVTPGPWFMAELSIVDLQCVTHIERMCASCAFWSHMQIRGSRWPGIERWLQAFEAMPSGAYLATKADYYSSVMDIPPQYGPGYSAPGSELWQREILGEDGSWELPLKPLSAGAVEPFPLPHAGGEEAARQEAAYEVISSFEAIVKFACRGPGQPGKRFQAPLADPYAVPNLDFANDVDGYLRLVCQALVSGEGAYETIAVPQSPAAKKKGVAEALCYLRDRVGVPRDMSLPAARQLRAHLNWVIGKL